MRLCAIVLLVSCLCAPGALAQTSAGGTLRGRVSDPSGAVVTQAKVTATGPSGKSVSVQTNQQGTFEIHGLTPGSYHVTIAAKGFAEDNEPDVHVTAGQTQDLDIRLQIEVEQQHIEVQEEGPTVGVSPESSAGTIVLQGKDLDALSDDPDELQSELEALAGPSAGPNGGQIYVDGFTAGQLPPKSAIREIRINQDPFSAEYDKLGYGRIEIFTKPGTDQLHGQFLVNGNSSAFNTLNPFVTSTPGYFSEIFNGNLSGPINKKASFFLTVQQRDIDNVSTVVAHVLGPGNVPTPYTANVNNPAKRLNISPRVDFQLTPNNTLTLRYQFVRNTQDNAGIGGLSLPSTGFNSQSTEQTVQITDTQIIRPTIVNETRFQYIRDSDTQLPLSLAPTLVVQDEFTGGGSSFGTVVGNQDHYELQNFTSIVHGKHFFKFGGRLRGSLYSSNQDSGFNGSYNFSSLSAYQITVNGLEKGLTPMQIRAMGGGASQFTLVSGFPLSDVSMIDVGLYAQDEWKIKPNFTFSYGLRYETQTGIPYEGNWAPRISLAYGLGHSKQPKTVLRGGFGIFYDRFSYDYLLQAERFNGFTQQQYVVANPNFYPLIPTPAQLSMLATNQPTSYQVAGNLHVPYALESAFSVEQQVAKSATVSVTYLNSRGIHQLLLRNANAFLPGTYPPSDVRPFGGNQNIYQYNSGGVYEENQLIANVRFALGNKVSLFGFYSLSFANSDLGSGGPVSVISSGPGGGGFGAAFGNNGVGTAEFVSNSYDPLQDYGRAAFDVRNRVFVGGTISLPYALRLSPFILANSGTPFNIIVAQDLNGDSIFNDRPALATTAGTNGRVIVTPYGTFNTVPIPGQTLAPINYGYGPALFTLNLRLSKTIGLGPKVEGRVASAGGPGGHGSHGGGLGARGLTGGGGSPFIFGNETGHKYNLTFSVSARNLLNIANYGPPLGNLDSTSFGTPISLAPAPFSSGAALRRIDLQMLFSF